MDAVPKIRPPPPVVPALDAWNRMSQAEQDDFIEAVNAYHSDPAEVMAEGRPHKRAKSDALDALTLHFAKLGRPIYLADEMSVLYPGEESFVPDILAVVGVEQPADDERQAWVVAREGRGLDLVIEVLHSGDRNKDLVRNVAWYARLGIPEYFVYDRRHQKLYGWRLGARGIYDELKPVFGRLTSTVLGLDLAIAAKKLRFYTAHAELVGSAQLIERLSTLVDDVEARADVAEAARLEAERGAEHARAEADRAAAALRTTISALLAARGIVVSEEIARTIASCADPDRLARWAVAAATAPTAEDVLARP